jgi:cytochrome c-type biogenesis protein CcmH
MALPFHAFRFYRLFACLLLVLLGLMVASLLPLPLQAQEAPALSTEQEAIAREMFRKVRCVVCSGQTIADSNSALADSMRNYIRQQLASGMPPEVLEQQLRHRYGEEVIMEVSFSHRNLLLWLLPFAMLGIAALLATLFIFRRRSSNPQEKN